jgi:hypothetical protein
MLPLREVKTTRFFDFLPWQIVVDAVLLAAMSLLQGAMQLAQLRPQRPKALHKAPTKLP